MSIILCLATILAINASRSSSAGATAFAWTTTGHVPFCTATGAGAVVRQVKHDGAGDRFVAGTFSGTLNCGPGSGATIAAEGTGSNVFVVSYTPAGVFRWVRRIGNTTTVNQPYGGIAITPDGAVVLAATTYGQEHLSGPYGDRVIGPAHGGYDVFLGMLYGPDGHLVWGRVDGGAANDRAWSVAVDRLATIYVSGSFTRSATFGDAPSPVTITSTTTADDFAASYTSTGAVRFATDIAQGDTTNLRSDVAVGSGGLYVVGQFVAGVTINGTAVSAGGPGQHAQFVVRLDTAAGAVQWTRLLGGKAAGVNALSPVVATDGNLYLAGTFFGVLTYGPPGLGVAATLTGGAGGDVVAIRVASNGAYQWGRTGGATGAASATEPAAGGAGTLILTGQFSATLPLGGTGLTSSGGADGFLVEWYPSGVVQTESSFGGAGSDAGLAVTGPSTTPPVLVAQTSSLPVGVAVSATQPVMATVRDY